MSSAAQQVYDLPVEFRGTQRYEVREVLGRGGMGVVYRALDRELGAEVALKTLRALDAQSLLRFKNEFRSLADMSHPNLVSLHDMVKADDTWFFTMELVDGVDFMTYLRGASGPDPLSSSTTISSSPVETVPTMTTVSAIPDLAQADGPATEIDAGEPARGPDDMLRLRDAFRQLAAGVHALHLSGHLHRDIKPSNIRVTGDGRVVLLDFGIVADVVRPDSEKSDFAGTPAYMAPEQARKDGATPASDWYSVGVVLYQALTGRLPFSGNQHKVILEKQSTPAPPAHQVWPLVPSDLDELCAQLLDHRAKRRPAGSEVIARLGDPSAPSSTLPGSGPRPTLYGRKPHLSRLRDALERSRNQCVTLLLHGRSGMGKSELVQRFLDALPDDTVILRGRCYEKESVPFKAVDSLIDSLSRYLAGLPPSEIEALVPERAELLSAMFPVLARIEALASADEPRDGEEPQELRRLACLALRELLGRLCRDRRIVLFVDDLQWGDPDSAPVLESVISPPGAPPLLLLGSYRDDEEERSGFLRALTRSDDALGQHAVLERLEVGRLLRGDAIALAESLGHSQQLAARIADESGGNPYLLSELARFSRDRHDTSPPSLGQVFAARLDALDPPARRLVEVAAVAGRPIEQRIAKQAAQIDDAEWAQVVQSARAGRLIRMSGTRGGDLIECYHDRLRDAVADAIEREQLQQHHRRLAAAIEATPRRDPEILAGHLLAAGDADAAAGYVMQAAQHAVATLAFDRAASLFSLALDIGVPDTVQLRSQLARALVDDGRGADSAEQFLAAAGMAAGSEALELRRHAAEQLLRSGHVDRGLDVLRSVLAELRLRLPATPLRAIPSAVWNILRLRLRGLRHTPRALGEIDDAERMRIEVCRTAVTGLAMIDPARAAPFAARALLLSLASGEPKHLATSLANQAVFQASARNPRRSNELMRKADALAAELEDPQVDGYLATVRAILFYENGDFRDAFRLCAEAEQMLRGRCTGVAWELRTTQLFATSAMLFLGRIDQLMERVPVLISDARRRGDLYAITNMRSQIMPALFLLVHDDVAAARNILDQAEEQWTRSGFYLQHMFILFMRTLTDIYAGDGVTAHERCESLRGRLTRTLLLEDRSVRTFWCFISGTAAALAASQSPAARKSGLRAAKRTARTLERDGAPPYRGMACNVRASLYLARGDRARAEDCLRRAIKEFESAEMTLFVHVLRHRLGVALGNGSGEQMIAAAETAMKKLGVVNPQRLAAAFSPTFG